MLRVTRTRTNNATLIKLEGSLRDQWVPVAREMLAAESREYAIDLSAVTYVDTAGRLLLNELLRSGVRVVAASGFVAQVLKLREGHEHTSCCDR